MPWRLFIQYKIVIIIENVDGRWRERCMSNHTELKKRERSLFVKSILIIDDNPDITLTFKKGLEAENNKKSENNNIFFEVFAYNDPILALSEFKPTIMI